MTPGDFFDDALAILLPWRCVDCRKPIMTPPRCGVCARELEWGEEMKRG